jgi:hypothetical protein
MFPILSTSLYVPSPHRYRRLLVRQMVQMKNRVRFSLTKDLHGYRAVVQNARVRPSVFASFKSFYHMSDFGNDSEKPSSASVAIVEESGSLPISFWGPLKKHQSKSARKEAIAISMTRQRFPYVACRPNDIEAPHSKRGRSR